MDEMTVTQFASELKMPAAALLEQLRRAGVMKNAESELLTEQDKADIAAKVWGVPLAQAQTPGTIGEWVSKKILSLKQFLALT